MFARLSSILGRKAFDEARRHYPVRVPRFGLPLFLANILALILIAVPIIMFVGSLVLIWSAFPSIPGMIYGGGLLLISWVLLPKFARAPKNTLSRKEYPALYAAVDLVCSRLDAPRIESICITDDFNAYLAEYRRWNGDTVRTLGIGLLMWESLSDEEKIALLGHEIGHAINNDPRRQGLLRTGILVIENWGYWFSDPASSRDYSDGLVHLVVRVLSFGFRVFLDLLWSTLNVASMYQSQVAEYVADSASVKLGGKQAALNLLFKSICWQESNWQHTLYGRYFRGMAGEELVEAVVRQFKTQMDEMGEVYLKRAHEEGHSVDRTHPASSLRQAFIETLPVAVPLVTPTDIDFSAISDELKPFRRSLGDQIADCAEW